MTDRLRALPALVLIAVCVLTVARLGVRSAAREEALRAAGFERAHTLAAAAVAEARAARALWLDTEEYLARARRAWDQGYRRNALLFVQRARREARLASNQARLEAARYFLEHGLTPDAAPDAAQRLRERVLAHDGAGAWSLARALGAESAP
jgi:hypothetical protein